LLSTTEHFLREFHIANILKHSAKNVAASVQRLMQLGPIPAAGFAAGLVFFVNYFATVSLKRCDLGRGILFIGRDAGVTYLHLERPSIALRVALESAMNFLQSATASINRLIVSASFCDSLILTYIGTATGE
jgi:hypothetical protein